MALCREELKANSGAIAPARGETLSIQHLRDPKPNDERNLPAAFSCQNKNKAGATSGTSPRSLEREFSPGASQPVLFKPLNLLTFD